MTHPYIALSLEVHNVKHEIISWIVYVPSLSTQCGGNNHCLRITHHRTLGGTLTNNSVWVCSVTITRCAITMHNARARYSSRTHCLLMTHQLRTTPISNYSHGCTASLGSVWTSDWPSVRKTRQTWDRIRRLRRSSSSCLIVLPIPKYTAWTPRNRAREPVNCCSIERAWNKERSNCSLSKITDTTCELDTPALLYSSTSDSVSIEQAVTNIMIRHPWSYRSDWCLYLGHVFVPPPYTQ